MSVAAPMITLLAALLAIRVCAAAASRPDGPSWTQQGRSLSRRDLLGPDSRHQGPDRAQRIVNRPPQDVDHLPPEDRRFLQRAASVPVVAGRPAWIPPYDPYYWGHHGHKHHRHHGHKHHKHHKRHWHKHHKRHEPKHHRYYGPKHHGPGHYSHGHRRVPRSLDHIWRKLKKLGRGIKDLVHDDHRHKTLPGYRPVYRSGAEGQTPVEQPRPVWPDQRDGGATTDPRWSDPGWQDSREAGARTDPGWARPGWPHDPRDAEAGTDPGWSNPNWQDPSYDRNDPSWSDPGWSNPHWLNGRDGGVGADPRLSDPRWSDPRWSNPDPVWPDPGWPARARPARPGITTSPTEASTTTTTSPETTTPPATTTSPTTIPTSPTTSPPPAGRGDGVLVITVRPRITGVRRSCPAGFTFHPPSQRCHERCPSGASYYASTCYCDQSGFAVDFVLWRCAPAGGAGGATQ